MKQIIFVVALLYATYHQAEAQNMFERATEYSHTELLCTELQEVQSSLPVTLTITNDQSNIISIDYPTAVESKVNFRLWNDVLIIEPKDETITDRDLMPLGQQIHILVEVPSSHINSITNTSDMGLILDNDTFAERFEIINARSLWVTGDRIKAQAEIDITNMGTLTLEVATYDTTTLKWTNSGAMFVDGETTATLIEHTSMGIEHTSLEVNCHNLEIVSAGSGIIEYQGIADEVNVTSMGEATIRTSGLNVEP